MEEASAIDSSLTAKADRPARRWDLLLTHYCEARLLTDTQQFKGYQLTHNLISRQDPALEQSPGTTCPSISTPTHFGCNSDGQESNTYLAKSGT